MLNMADRIWLLYLREKPLYLHISLYKYNYTDHGTPIPFLQSVGDINSLSVEWKPRSLARLLSLPLKSAKMPSSLPWLSGNFNGSSKDGHMFEEPLWSEKKLPAITQVSLPLIIFNVHSVRLDIIIILNGIISREVPQSGFWRLVSL